MTELVRVQLQTIETCSESGAGSSPLLVPKLVSPVLAGGVGWGTGGGPAPGGGGGIKHRYKEIDIDIDHYMENDIDISACSPHSN